MGVFLWVYFIYLNSNFKPNKLKNILNETVLRYFVMEHAVMMFIALILIHLGVRKAKRTISGADANKAQFRFFLAALILILVAIPWPFYGVIGRGWF
jgi:ABC-type microcin C transport system permease subunit YejB